MFFILYEQVLISQLYVGEHNPNSDEKQFLLALDYLNISSAVCARFHFYFFGRGGGGGEQEVV